MAVTHRGDGSGRKKRSRRERLAEHAERLAPPEEKGEAPPPNPNESSGAIIINTGALKLPKGVGEEGAGGRKVFGLDPVVFAILVIALLFIGFITFLIAREPPKSEPPPAKIGQQ